MFNRPLSKLNFVARSNDFIFLQESSILAFCFEENKILKMLLIKKINEIKSEYLVENRLSKILLKSECKIKAFKILKCFYLVKLSLFLTLGCFVSSAFSQATDEPLPTPGFGEILSKMSPMLMMVFFIFYFLVVRPQNKKLIEQQKLLAELKKGDGVLTTGGMHAQVFSIESDHVILEPSVGVKLKFDKTSIASRVG